MAPTLIKTESQYEQALARIDALMDAEPGTPEGDELDLLVALVQLYEARAHPIALPDPISAIRFRMEQQGLRQKDLVAFLGSKSRASEVLRGKRPLSLNMIRALHEGLGIPAEVLLGKPRASIPLNTEGLEWGRFPLGEMLKRGWLGNFKGTIAEAREHAEELVRGFFEPLCQIGVQPAFCRQHVRSRSQMDEYAILAWRARVLILARSPEVGSYNAGTISKDFMADLVHLSYLSQGPLLAREFLARNGIHLVIVPHLPKTHLDGAAMILPSGNPVVGLTLCYDRLDNFWFTLCHELGHVALHLAGKPDECYLDDIAVTKGPPVERQADKFAEDSLIPPGLWRDRPVRRANPRDIISFADKIRVHRAIVAGRIRREKGNYRIASKLVGQGQVRRLFGVAG